MCKLIAELVGADKQIVSEVVRRLELASGQPGIDVRLSGEIYGRTHMKIRELGLDPYDTTAKELYQALVGLADLHDQFLAQRLGISDRTNTESVLSAVAMIVNKLLIPRQAWVIRGSVIRKLLKAHPPQRLMESLHYRSVESMLKKERAPLLLTMARHIEGAQWQQQFSKACGRLQSGDFQQRDVEVTYLDALRWSAVVQKVAPAYHTNTFYCAEAGAIFITPLPARGRRGLTLASLMMVLHYVNDIRTQSTYLKFYHLMPGFGQKIESVVGQHRADHIRVAGQSIQWSIVHKYYGTTTRLLHPEVFEPHIQPEDLAYRKAESILYRFEPALHFWHNLDYIGVNHYNAPISFNLMDIVLSLLNDIPYEKRLNYHMRDALWNELLIRYVGQRPLERQLLQHLGDQTLSEAGLVPQREFVL